MIRRCQDCFREQHIVLWPALSRSVNLLAILNVSLFFLTGAVRTGGYWFPLVSLALLALASLLILLPLGFHDRLGYYLLNVALCVAAGWLLGASIVYWLNRAS
ncbi:MAG: hypothetical protein Q8Q59_14480 [Luteolibacter sp.]|jgi:hypothetical protein|nr:hypothetical protein [Luteolibacter sp.]